uniref:Ferric-chelate reductase 1a n=1 Tax=Sander lucioperca TaxID=283035 RepID=A0A8C9XB61_SANLU
MSPMGLYCLLFISVLVCYWVPAGCYADGKVTKVCGSMEPHHGVPSQTAHSPYSLETNSTKFSPGDQIKVTLVGTSYFEGFLLQARDAANQSLVSTVGTFTLTNLKKTQLLTCNKHQGSAVSHTSDARQTEVVVIWNAPTYAPRQVQFFVTVVKHYSLFWVKLPGPIIYQHGVTPHPPHVTTFGLLIFTSEGCGQSKSCLLDPPGCDPKEDPHCFFLSMTTEGPDKMSMVFELSGPAEGYIAFALSWDKWMGNDDVYMCVKDGDRVLVSAAFVSGRTHPEDQSESVLSSVSWRLADGHIQCRLSRPVKLTNQKRALYDLDKDYFLFLANGHAQYGKVWKHSQQPLISSHRKHLTGPPEILRGSRAPIIMKMHGALMLLAWMLTGSVGTFIASFYKSDWPNQTVFGQKIWFQVDIPYTNRFIFQLVRAQGPFLLLLNMLHAGVHPYLGCCVLTLSLTQPVMAAIRPSPDSHSRYIFNWGHWGVGYIVSFVTAVAAMFLGMRQSSLLLPQPWATHVLIGYVTWLALFRSLLLMHRHIYIKKCMKTSDEFDDTELFFMTKNTVK